MAAGAQLVQHEHEGDHQLEGQVAVARGRCQEVLLDTLLIKMILCWHGQWRSAPDS